MNGFGIVRLTDHGTPYFAKFYDKYMSGGNLSLADSLDKTSKFVMPEDWIFNLLSPHNLVEWNEE